MIVYTMEDGKRKRTSPDEMSNDVDADEIREIVNEIIASPGTVREKETMYERKYPSFAKRFPVLLKMACKPDFDRTRLEQIFEMMGMVRNNEVTYEKATEQFGQQMFDTYVKPNLRKKQ